jgi:hypothetical protein
MAIDDPLSAAKNQIQAEERNDELALPRELATRVAGLLPGPLSDIVKSALQRDEAERSWYLLHVLEQELVYLRERVQKLQDTDDEHRRFMKEEFPPLLLEGFRKAAQTRAKSRIRRIAAILSSSISNASIASPDETEEFLKIATELSERDVWLLQEISRLQGNFVTGDGMRLSSKTWAHADLRRFGMGVPDVFEIGPKLESFGLVRETDESRRATSSPKPWPYALLPKGSRFIRCIHLSAEADAAKGDHL